MSIKYHPDRPKQPVTGYFRYAAEKRDSVVGSATEKSKLIAELWKNEDESVRKQHNEDSRQEMEVFKKKLKEFYDSHPGEKEREAAERESEKQKKLEKKEEKEDKPIEIKETKKPSAKAIKDYFYVAYLKKYREQNQYKSENKFIPFTTKTVKMINQQYEQQVVSASMESVWQQKWQEFTADQRKEISSFLDEWKKTCKQ